MEAESAELERLLASRVGYRPTLSRLCINFPRLARE